MRHTRVWHGFGFLDLGSGRAHAAKGAARATPDDSAKAVHVALEKGVGQRQSALAGPAQEASTEALVLQVRGVVDPFRHDESCWWLVDGGRDRVLNFVTNAPLSSARTKCEGKLMGLASDFLSNAPVSISTRYH